MIMSIPVPYEFFQFTEDTPEPSVLYTLAGAIPYAKDTLFASNGVYYKATKPIRLYNWDDAHAKLVNQDSTLIHHIVYEGGVKKSYFPYKTNVPYGGQLLFEDAGGTPVVLLKDEYAFVAFDRPFAVPNDAWLRYDPDTNGDIGHPGGTLPYTEFVNYPGSSEVHVKQYSGGTSETSPGSLDSETTLNYGAFAASYPDLIMVTNEAIPKFFSTAAGQWTAAGSDPHLFLGDLSHDLSTIANDPKLVKALYPTFHYVNDGKSYTYKSSTVEMSFYLWGKEAFDTVAMTGLIADTVTVKFYNEADTQIGADQVITVDNKRDAAGNLEDYPVTRIVYSPNTDGLSLTRVIPKNGHVRVTLTGDEIQLGSLYLGLALDMGLTDFTFTTKFIDLSPVEENFNVIEYVEGLKIKEYTGGFSVWTEDVDRLSRTLVSLGQGLVIVNGSDTIQNEAVGDKSRFEATMVVGRLRSLPVTTTKEKDRIGELAKAKFVLREIV